jgi:hypothetical protein
MQGTCSQSGACPTAPTTTQTVCQGANGQCNWTGACAAPNCPTTGAATQTGCQAVAGCTWSGACATGCTGGSQANCTSIASCTWTPPAGDGGTPGVSSTAGGFVPYGWVPFYNVAIWQPDDQISPPNTGYPDTTFARGVVFQQWLAAASWTISDPKYDIEAISAGVTGVTGNIARFAYSSTQGLDASAPATSGGPNSVIDFTFDVDAGSSAAGRVMFTDMHLSEQTQTAALVTDGVTGPPKWAGNNSVPVFNPTYTLYGGAHECQVPEAGLNEQERVAEFLFFDLGACTGSGLGVAAPIGSTAFFEPETYTLDLCMAPSGAATSGGCPNTCSTSNSSVVWRYFNWTSIVPGESDGGTWGGDSGLGPNLMFSFQTASTEAGLGLADAGGINAVQPMPPPGSPDTSSGSFRYDVNTLLGAGNSETWIRIYMTLSPDSTHTIAPTLTNYQQQFDCIPAQ